MRLCCRPPEGQPVSWALAFFFGGPSFQAGRSSRVCNGFVLLFFIPTPFQAKKIIVDCPSAAACPGFRKKIGGDVAMGCTCGAGAGLLAKKNLTLADSNGLGNKKEADNPRKRQTHTACKKAAVCCPAS